MEKIVVTLLMLGLCTALIQAAVTVNSVVVAQRPGTKLVDISYNVSGGGYYTTAIVSLSVLSNGTHTVNTTNVTGDIGPVPVGSNKSIVWDAGADWNGIVAQDIFFRVTAEGDATAY